jgi:molybdopterin/thiamine biosynthesis adenylyltransferase
LEDNLVDYTRISSAIDVAQTSEKGVTIVGAAPHLACNLARCGVRAFTLIDFDQVSVTNIPRQGFLRGQAGALKVEAVAAMIRQINADAEVTCLPLDFTAMTEEETDLHVGGSDLLLLCTDSFAAQAHGNEVALRLNTSAVWVGLYAGGRAGEIIFWHPDLDACFHCLTARRYSAHAAAAREGRSLDVQSAGATVLDIDLLDAIAGQVAVGLLTRGAPNRFGCLIDQLGDRNFLQLKIDPTYRWNGRDIIREQLQVPEETDTFFAWNTIVRRDPQTNCTEPCPDCARYRGHHWVPGDNGSLLRVKPTDPGDDDSAAQGATLSANGKSDSIC